MSEVPLYRGGEEGEVVCVCVCVREREKEREREKARERERERERERARERECVFVCVLVVRSVADRGREEGVVVDRGQRAPRGVRE